MKLFEILGTIAIAGAAAAQKDIDNTSAKASNFGDKLKDGIITIGKWGAAIGTAAVTGGTLLAKMASNFEDSMAKVSTIADDSEVSMDAMQKSIIELSDQTGISSSEIAENVYNAISAGQKTGDAVNFVSKATQLAKAGFAESGAALDILTTIMNAYGMEASAVDDVSNKLIMTQNLGKTTVGELSSAMGKVIPTANALGVDMDELCASYAVLTSNGIATAESTTYMNSMLNELGKGGTKANDALAEYTKSTFGASKSVEDLMKEGYKLNDIVGMVSNHAKKSGKSIADMFGSAEGAKAAQVILTNSEKFDEVIGQMGDSAGATETAYKKMDSTVSSKVDKLKIKLSNMGITLGKKLLPVVDKVLDLITKNMPVIQGMIDKLAPALENIFNDVLPLLAELAGELLPIIVNLFNDILPVVSQLAKTFLPIFVDIIKTIVPPLAQIAESILPVLTSLMDGILPLMQGFLDILKPIFDVVVAIITPISNLASGLMSGLASAFEFLTGKTSESVIAAQKEAEEMRNVRIAAEEAREAVDKKAERELANVSTVEGLWKELHTLADEQGNVADKDRARADFITNQLEEALGIEIQWTGNQIQNYKDLQGEIDKTIEKKKAEILLAASEENYKVAVQNVTEAEKNKAEAMQQSAEAQAKLRELEEQGIVTGKKYNDAAKEAEAMQNKYIEATKIYQAYQSDIAEYEKAQTLILQGETEKAIDFLSQQGQALISAADLANKSKEEQLGILEDQVEEAAVLMASQAESLKGLSKDCTDEERALYEKSFNESKKQFEKAASEYQKAGGNIGDNFIDSISKKMSKGQFENLGKYMVEGIKSGVEANEIILYQEMSKLWNNAMSATGTVSVVSTSPRIPQMAEGGILKKGQIGFLEGNGDEAVVPLSKNTEWIDKVASKLNGSGSVDIASKLDELINRITSMNIVLDTGTMVGEMAPAMDAQLGDIYAAKERGR